MLIDSLPMKTTNPVYTVGLDLGDKRHAICVLNRGGEVIDERSITNHRESLRRLAKKYGKADRRPCSLPHCPPGKLAAA